MRFFIKVTLIVLFCFINIGFCEDNVKVVVIPLLSDETCTGNASSDDVLSGKTFSNSNDKDITGTMPNQDSLNFFPGTANIPIDQGYYNGTGYVEGDSDLVSDKIKDGVTIFGVEGTFPSDGTAVEAEVKTGSTFYTTSGTKITGSGTKILSNANDTVVGGYYDATTLSAIDANLTAENIKGGVTIFGVTGTNRSHKCGAYITANVWKIFDCYNFAAIGQTTNDDPFTPSWRLIGGYWQWGRKGPDSSQWYNTNTANFAHGPTGPESGDANDGAITGWDTTYAPDGSWSDASKTVNDPCPAGYRVPTKTQWDGVVSNNTQSITGSWSDSATNYSSTRFFGNDLMLPAAGYRLGSSGSLYYRGYYGGYWSSSQYPGDTAWFLYFYSSTSGTYYNTRRNGFSVRCVAE